MRLVSIVCVLIATLGAYGSQVAKQATPDETVRLLRHQGGLFQPIGVFYK